MRFLQPQYFKLLFLLAALLPLWLYQLLTKLETRLHLGDRHALARSSYLSSLRAGFLRILLFHLVLASLIVALAHPQRMREKSVAQPKGMDIVFLLDTSPSMRAEDISPSRLGRATEVIERFSRQKPPEDRIGLVSFSGGSLILSYLTSDPDNIPYYLDYLRDEITPGFGTNIGLALRNGLTVLTKDVEINPGAARHKRVFVLVSDGEDHGAELEPALEEVKRRGLKVHTIGIGSEEGGPIPIARESGEVKYLEDQSGNRIITRFDASTLRRIAEKTGGNTYRSLTGQELEKLFAEIVFAEREIEGFKRVLVYEDLYQGFLLAALGFFLAAILV